MCVATVAVGADHDDRAPLELAAGQLAYRCREVRCRLRSVAVVVVSIAMSEAAQSHAISYAMIEIGGSTMQC